MCGKQERQRVAASNINQSDLIKVDVGGSQFHVSRSTLTAQPDSLLDSLFSGRFRIDTQADSSVFIDRYVNAKSISACPSLDIEYSASIREQGPHSHPRDPEHFPRILAFLRDGVVDEVAAQAHPSLLREAHFYSLDPLIRELEVCCCANCAVKAPRLLQSHCGELTST